MKLNFKYLTFVFVLLLILTSFPQSQEFLIQKYSVDNGLPDNRVNDIVQDSLGRMWVAMNTGIAMYDGVEWKKFDEKDGVPEIEYIRIKIDEKGIIWFLPARWGNNFIIYYKNKKWQKFKLPDFEIKKLENFTSFDVKNISNIPEICIATLSEGILLYRNNKTEWINTKRDLLSDYTTKTIFYDENIYISSLKGLSVINKDNVIKNYDFLNSGLDPMVLSMGYYISPDNKMRKLYLLGKNWMGEFVNEKIKLINNNFNLLFAGINDMYAINIHPSGEILFGGRARVFSYNLESGLITQIIFDNPSTNRGANSIFIDYEQNIWFVSLRGIFKCRYSAFRNYKRKEGLLEDEVSAISEFNNGELVLGHNYGISIKNKNSYKHIVNGSYKVDARQVRVLDFYHDVKNDIIYYTSYNKGIGKLFPTGKSRLIKEPFISLYYTLFRNNNSQIIATTDKGLFRVKKNKLIPVISETIPMFRKGLCLNDTTTYLASAVGLFAWTSNGVKLFQNFDIEANNIYSLFSNQQYGLLVGSIKGIYKLENDSLKKFSFNGQEVNESVYFITEDRAHNLWIGTNNGVLKWDRKVFKRYNKSDGLAGNETNRAAGFVDSKGNVWIGTDEGLSLYTGNEIDYSSIKPKLILNEVEDERDKKYDLSSDINLDPDDNSLTFNYKGLSFIDESKNIYEVKLSKINDDWNNKFFTKYAYSRFNNLQHGNYVFSVRVKNSKGIWSDWKKSSLITINKHYYQQPLFIVANILLSLFIFYYIYNYVQQKKYTKRLEEAVNSRTTLLKEKQSELVTSLERYRGIVDSQTDLVVRVDANNKLTFVNDAYCKVFGKTQESLIGNSFFPFVHPDDRTPTSEAMNKLKYPPHRVTIEQRALTVNGYRWLAWEDYAIFDNKGKLKEVQGVGRDITLQKEIEAELEKRVRERTTELKSLVSQSPFGIMTFDKEGFLIDFNITANNLFKNLSETTISQKLFNIYNDEFLLKNNYKERLSELNSSRGLLITGRILVDNSANEIYKNLFSRYLIYRIYTVEYEDKSKNLVLLLEDVTDIQKTEEVTKKLSEEKIRIATFIKTVETERQRISKELHDGIGQLLTTAKLKLDIFRLKTNVDKKEVDDALNILLNAGDEIRRIINDLRPYDIDNFGLIAAIELLCDRIRQTPGLNIQYSVTNFKELSDKKRENLTYRIIQEALNNIIKHSNCKNAGVNIVGSDKSLIIEIWDDGNGFDQTDLEKNKIGFGIGNMKERANLLGGTITFSASINSGLKVTINIPIETNV